MKTMKRFVALALATALTIGGSMTAMAAGWQQNSTGWWYDNGNGTWPANSWQWIDGNGDGVAECYYFDGNGYMLSNTTTPDGYTVDGSGAWNVNGVVQTQVSNATPGNNNTGTVSGYNADGISNVAIDLLHSTRAEANAKYGPEIVSPYVATPDLGYPNIPFGVGWDIKQNHEAAYEADRNNMDNYYIAAVTCKKPSDMVNFLTSADDNKTPLEMITYLKSKGYDAKGNNGYCYVTLGDYQVQFYSNRTQLNLTTNR